jgi:hypothetical protein
MDNAELVARLCAMNDDAPCTQEQRDAIVAAAVERRGYILWLADWLEHIDRGTSLPCLYAADELRKLAGGTVE